MKSSFSNPNGACIDVSLTGEKNDLIAIRETRPIGFYYAVAVTDRSRFKAFIEGVKAGEFDHFVEDI